MPQPIIVFDLDGTLVDTAPDLLASLNHCLGLAELRPVEAGDLRQFVGMGGRVMIERAFEAQRRDLADGQMDGLLAAFLDHYGANMPGELAPYPGAVAAMDRFERAGYLAAVCTNKYEAMSRTLLGALGLAPRFRAICGQDTFVFRKPDPRHLVETILMAGGSPDHAIMVGDSLTDIATARAAGIPVVAVDFGYTDRHVSEFEPSHVISHYDELTPALAGRLLAAAAR